MKVYKTKRGLTAFFLEQTKIIDLQSSRVYYDDIRELAGVINGQTKSERKSKTSAENGKKGGRPRKKVLPIQKDG